MFFKGTLMQITLRYTKGEGTLKSPHKFVLI